MVEGCIVEPRIGLSSEEEVEFEETCLDQSWDEAESEDDGGTVRSLVEGIIPGRFPVADKDNGLGLDFGSTISLAVILATVVSIVDVVRIFAIVILKVGFGIGLLGP